MSGAILRRRDRTDRPPRVDHYSAAVNTMTARWRRPPASSLIVANRP